MLTRSKAAQDRSVFRVADTLGVSRRKYSELDPHPSGTRLPHGLPWAEKQEDFFLVQDKKDKTKYAPWSKTMIEDADYKLNGRQAVNSDREIGPVQPYPVLRHLQTPPSERLSINGQARKRKFTEETAGELEVDKRDAARYRPKLEEFLPLDSLPEVLWFHDSERLTAKCTGNSKKTTLYIRKWPPIVPKDIQARAIDRSSSMSTLTVTGSMGTGSHAGVFKACLRLPPKGVQTENIVAFNVAAKLANREHPESQTHLWREASAYAYLSTERLNHLQQDWPGFMIADRRSRTDLHHQPFVVTPASAIVPKFYGMYVPQNKETNFDLSPVLLMEDCGMSVHDFKESEEFLNWDAAVRTQFCETLYRQIPAMFNTLFLTGFCQASIKLTNVTIQPGPLSKPVSQRSYETPSCRVIDFGRTLGRRTLENREFERDWNHPSVLFFKDKYFLSYGREHSDRISILRRDILDMEEE